MDNVRICVRLPDGAAHRLEAPEGWRVMEVIRDWGLPIKAECGGAGACATCHVRVADHWLGKLPEPSAEEIGKLDEVLDVDDRSRLACQILTARELDGLEVELVPDSLVSQTSWTGG
jgi:2Fe-2S ferredoxin